MSADRIPPAEAPSTRLLTSLGTALYVDPGSGELRHGPVATSPGNCLFVADPESAAGGREGWLMHDAADGREPIVCAGSNSWAASRAAMHGLPAAPTRLMLVPLERGLVGLRAGGRYLCAEPPGPITLSRDRCSGWEAFLPVEDWCTAPLPVEAEREVAGLAATVDWKSIAAVAIDPARRPQARELAKPKRLKVAVYTIALNEAAHAERWANSAADADYRIVADTGSTDDTVALLERAGVTVHHIAVRPWRFDDARNAALALIPADVDVCCSMDMDEFLELGWRAPLEASWTPGTTALYCRLARGTSLDDPAPRAWPAKKFHARWGYRFRRAVHEALFFTGETEAERSCDAILVHHLQDHGKGTRAQYLPLLEVAHREDPNDAQICFWLARDLMWANRREEAIAVMRRYLELPASTWREERAEAMRILAQLQPGERMAWLDKARIEAPHRRETWLDLAQEFHGTADWPNLFWACANGIDKTWRTGSYLDDQRCWGPRLLELGSIACAHLGAAERMAEWAQQALELAPGDQRLKESIEALLHPQQLVPAAQ